MSTKAIATPPSTSSRARGNSKGSQTTPVKKGFFNKILRRTSQQKAPESPEPRNPYPEYPSPPHDPSVAPGSNVLDEFAKSAGPYTSSTPRNRSRSIHGRDASLVSNRSKRNSLGSFIDDDNTSLFDDDLHDLHDDSDRFSLSTNTSYDSHSRPGDVTEKIRFPTAKDNEDTMLDLSLFPSNEEAPWEGLSPDALVVPKYIKTTRKNKYSPRVINDLFLAQELNIEDDPEEEVIPGKIVGNSSASSEEDEDDEDTMVSTSHNTNSFIDSNGSPAVSDQGKSKKKNHGEIFVLEFSRDGKYMAASGRDSTIRIWKVISSPLGRLESKSPSVDEKGRRGKRSKSNRNKIYESAPVFHQKPYMILKGHTQSVLTLDWSKNNFLVSGSMDRTVKLWHIDRDECLQTFSHEDFVTSVKFHPNDDRFFLSGSLDNKVRLWSILENNVAYIRDLGDNTLITALAVTPDGEFCIVGGFYGTIFALEVNGLHLKSRIEVKNRSLVHPFSHKNGNKITGIKIYETLQYNEKEANDPLSKWAYLITTNDSKVRLVNSTQKKLLTRFKGLTNNSASIYASLSEDNHYIICGSEDHWCYIWENNNSIINNKLRTALKELVIEGKHHLNDLQHKHKKYAKLIQDNKLVKKLMEADAHSEHISNENNSYTSFHAHNSKVNAAVFAPDATKKLLELSDDVIFDLVKRFKGCKYYQEHEKNKKTCGHGHGSPPPEEEPTGHIIVTTDQYGVIRVFRQDAARKIRKQFIDITKKKSDAKSEDPDCLHTAKSLIDLPSRGLSRHKSMSPSREGLFFKNKNRGKSSTQTSDSSKLGSSFASSNTAYTKSSPSPSSSKIVPSSHFMGHLATPVHENDEGYFDKKY